MEKINNNFEKIFPKENTVVMLHAHADDESFLSAGIMNEFIMRKYSVLLIYLATGIVDGEKRTLIRQKELSDALKILSIQNVECLKYCEPKYNEKGTPLYLQSIKRVSEEIKMIIKKKGVKNYTLFSYDKNGSYGNRDHLVVHKVGRMLLKTTSNVRSLVEVTIPREKYISWFSKVKSKVSEDCIPKLNYWSKDFGLKNKEINYIFSLNRKQLKLKRNALRKHESQVKKYEFPLSLNQDDFLELFGQEYFTYFDKSLRVD